VGPPVSVVRYLIQVTEINSRHWNYVQVSCCHL